ncbi:oligosaccharide flippase family protein [Acinetobacter johnsonii]
MNNLSKILSYSTLGTLCAFLIQLVSVKILSIQDYGVIAKWLTDLAFLSIFFVFGLDNSLLFFSKKDEESYVESYSRNIIFFSIILILLAIPLIVFREYNYLNLVICCYILAVIQSLNAYNQLNENFGKYGLINLSKNLFLFIFFGFSFLIGLKYSSFEYVFYYTISLLITLFFVICIGKRPKIQILNISSIFDRSYFSYGAKSMLNTFLAILLYSVTIYMIDIFLDKKQVALFFAATVLSKLAWVVPDSVGNLLYPKFLKIDIKYSKNQVMSETFFYAQLNFLLNVVAVIVFLILGNNLIKIFYGNAYLEMFYLVVILLIGNQGMVYYKILGRYLAAMNEWKIQRIALFCAAIFNIILNIILIRAFGVVGAAISTALAFWLCGLIITLKVKGSLIGFINLKSFFGKLLNAK